MYNFKLHKNLIKKSFLTRLFSIFLFLFIFIASSHGQYSTITDTLNCQGGTTTFVVDLSSNADTTWTSSPQTRAGDCCGTDNNCVQFSLTLAPGATGINFTIPGGCGAAPSGSLFYQVDCGPLTSVGTPICLNGTGPFVLTFCKPGNNDNCYSIQSIPAPSTAGDVITADGCTDTLAVTGLVVDSIVWNSIFPGVYADYNGLLSDITGMDIGSNGIAFPGHDTVVVTPGIGSPSVIMYEVCGTVTGFCTSEKWCDSVTVNIYPTLYADIQPNDPSICNGGTPDTLTANPIGGTAPYYFQWSTLADPLVDGDTTQSIVVSIGGVYSVMITDATGCPAGYDTVYVTEFSSDISVDAGLDMTICGTPTPSVTLSGSSPVTGTGVWTNYSGTFGTSDTDLNAVYTPSASEVSAGFAELYLASTNNYSCPGDVDTVIITLTQFTAALSLTQENVSCNGLSDGSIDLEVQGGPSPFTFSWSNLATTEDVLGLTPGMYQVLVTDSIGCMDSIQTTITEPAIFELVDTTFSDYNGFNISCNGFNDGAIDVSLIGGTTPYSFVWSTLDGSGLIVTDEDQFGLSAGTYTLVATDSGGCHINQSFTLTEPTALTETITANTFPSGDNISCNGLSDGSIDLTVAAGLPGYTYAWSTVNGSGLVPTAEDQTGLTAGTYDVTTTDINGCTITSSITLSEPTALTESASAFVYPSGDNISCNGLNNGSIDLTNTNGSPGYTYAWSTVNGSGLVATAEDQTGLTAGTYDVTTTDINGCTISSSITLSEPAALTEAVTAHTFPSGDNISCNGLSDGSIDLTVAAGSPVYTYAWSTVNGSGLVATAEDQTGLTAGTYDVTATDINGCTITSSITLSEPTALTEVITANAFPSGDNISCNGLSDGSIDLTVAAGSPVYTYAWSTVNGSGLVATAEDQTGLTAGTYDVTTTDINGCTITSSITLLEPTALTEAATAFIYPSGDNISCNGLSNGSIDLTNTNGSPVYTYSWSTVNGNGLVPTSEDQTGLTAGTYDVTTTDINGCTITSSITLSEPTALTEAATANTFPSGDNISCNGLSDGSIDLTVADGSPGYTYAWSTLNGSGLVATAEDQTGLTAGTYDVTTMDINGCTINSSITLSEPTALTEAATANTFPSGDNISCNGLSDGSIDLTVAAGSPGYTYAWSTVNGSGLAATAEDQTGLTAGTYDVTTTDINGCTITSSITLSEPTALTEAVTANTFPSGDNISCNGLSDGSIDLTNTNGSPGYTYAWSTVNGSGLVATAEDQTGLTAGTYAVTTTDTNGCTINSSITLSEPTALTEAITANTFPSGDNISCNGLSDGSIDLTNTNGSPGYTYAWSTVNGSGLAATAEDQTGLTAGTYDVTTTDTNGCTINSSITLSEPTALTEAVTANTFPSGDNISCNGLSDGSIDLTNTNGSPGYTYAWSTVNGSGLVATAEDQTGLTAGTYDVTTTDTNGCTINSSITLSEPTALTEAVTANTFPSGDNISCNGLSDGSIDLTVAAGSPGYTYAWSTINGSGLAATAEDQTGLTAGTYDVTTTDTNGCTINSSITLSEPTALTEAVTANTFPSGDNISCNGLSDGSIDLTNTNGSPGYTYAWSTVNGSGLVATAEDQTGLTAGTYDVTTTDTNGCTINSSITLSEPTALTEAVTANTFPSGDNISCNGLSDGSIDLTVAAGSPGYTYAWSTINGNGLAATAEDQTGLTAGTYDVTTTDINGCTINSSITLSEPTALTEAVTANTFPSGDNISCHGLSDGSIDLTNTNGSPGYTYAWSTVNGSGLAATSEDQTGLTAGTYDVTTTDTNGCTINSSITLSEPTALTEAVTANTFPSGDNISCHGLSDGSIDLTNTNGSPGYTYAWSTINGSGLAATAEDQTGLTAGTYDVTTTDTNGCTITSTITLVEPLLIATTLIPSVYAGGYNITGCNDDGTIDLQVIGGSQPFTYSWNSVNGTGWVPSSEDQAFLTEGTYIVTVTDTNNCAVVDSIFMDAAGDLVQSYTTSTYSSGHNISCFGLSDGSIDLTVTGGVGPYTFQWSNLAVTEDLDNIPAGTYTVTITDQNNCTETLSVTLMEPTALTSSMTAHVYPSGDNISCNGFADGSIDVTAENGSPGYTYSWTTLDGSGLFTTEEDQLGLTAGTYSVTVTDTNGCTITSTITLVEPPVLSVNINVLSDFFGMPVSCSGNSDGEIEAVVNGGSPDYLYSWNTAPVQTGPVVSGLSEGSYVVTITDLNGCIAIDTAELEANPLPILNPDPAIEVCEGEMVTFSSNSNPLEMCSWTISNGMVLDLCGPNTIYIAEPGCYDASLVVTNEFACSDSLFLSNYICINENPIADFSANTYDATIIENSVSFQNLSYGATDYEWDFGDGDISTNVHVTHSFPTWEPGEYNVVLFAYDEMGCFDSISKRITVWDELLFYTPNTFTPDGNEHNNVFVPVFGSGYSAEDYSFKIFNRWGEPIFESKDPAFGWDGTYNGVEMQVGTYTWKMTLKVSDITLAPTKKGVYTGHVNLLR